MTTTTITDQLTAITGPLHVRQHEDTITVSPANTQQISEILRYANENRLTITPIGGSTKQSWGNPVKANIRLELHRLNRVLEHPWQDLTCTVQAGCTWQHLQETLAQRGQFVALDPLFAHQATIGGILATNDSGALRHKYGSLRDLVIGMTLVLPDGTIARSGGRVVKNVAGYDLCKLLTGSLGTLAVITEATFRLHPLPQHPQTFTVSAPQATQLAPLMANIRASHLLTQALQLRGDSTGFHLDIQLNAHPEAHQDDILKRMTESAGLKLESPLAPGNHIASQRDPGGSSGLQAAESNPPIKAGFSPGPFENVWAARESLLQQENTIIIKATMLPEDVPAFAQEVAEKDGQSITQSLGIMYASFLAGQLSFKLAEEFRYHVGLQGGTTSLLARSLSLAKDDTWAFTTEGEQPITLPLMQAIKHQFDPNRTLNPGRSLGEI